MWGFAWVGPGATFVSRSDEDVFGIEIDHSEGDFARLAVDVLNPRRQLLSGPDIWCWLSLDGAQVFHGRLVAIPENMEAEVVRLNFMARPVGFAATKKALAETLKVAPFWDPVWIVDERVDDPDVVLESRTQIWHIDRVSHAVTVSDIITGEDGTTILGDDGFVYESLDVRYGSPPVRRVRVEAEVSWEQVAQGSVDMSALVAGAFGGIVSSYTGQGFEADWPNAGQNLGGGWFVQKSALRRVDGVSSPSVYRDVNIEGTSLDGFFSPSFKARFYRWDFVPEFVLGYDVRRSRQELIRFELVGDVQAVFTEPGEEEEIILGLASQKVGAPIDPGGAFPVGSLAGNAYAPTDRGRQSIGYLIALARAKLLARARAIEIQVTLPLTAALNLSCRQNLTIVDARLPAGTATGKVTSYRLVASGDGAQYAEVVIACTIGTGSTVSAAEGTATAVEGYVDGYQVAAGQTHSVIPGEVTFGDISGAPIPDDGVDFLNMTAAANVTLVTVENPAASQSVILSGSFSDISAAVETLNRSHTVLDLHLRPLTGGPFASEFDLVLSPLAVPMTMAL